MRLYPSLIHGTGSHSMNSVTIIARRREEVFHLDSSRVITKSFFPGGEDRIREIIDRVLSLSDIDAEHVLEGIKRNFENRHKDIWGDFNKHFQQVSRFIPSEHKLTDNKRLLIGAYFTHEYSIQSAAFFNPSIVPHPDQSGLGPGELRFVMSFRSTGEGHLSSIEFRSGIFKQDNSTVFDPVSRYVERADIVKNPKYYLENFLRKLEEMGWKNIFSETILSRLNDEFTFEELMKAISEYERPKNYRVVIKKTVDHMLWLARSNYEIRFDPEHSLSERVIFPVSENESSGIEDARFVRFVDNDGEVTYYATCTAFDGWNILPQIIVTKDFLHFRMITLNGEYAKDKGMALFPRRINGRYVMISRVDGENMYISTSDNIHIWNDAQRLQEPVDPWEFIQIGNCGSPIETSEGWLLITHGVGPMRQYFIGAILLDLDRPNRVIGKLRDPLLVPNRDEREGYVPNVVYSCGSLIHNEELIIPYAMSDQASTIAVVHVGDLLSALKSS
jgi:predicted GH43/DUF377 family glycosyl hydrolase